MNRTQQIKKHNLFYLLILLLAFNSCAGNDVYFQYHNVAQNGWSADSVYVYDVNIADTNTSYNVYVNVRNRGEYPHQNMWLFIKKTAVGDSVSVNDTINFYLADQRGKWLGSGVGSVFEMPVLYQQSIRFPKAGIYRYELMHGMRDSILIGVNDIGLRVEKLAE